MKKHLFSIFGLLSASTLLCPKRYPDIYCIGGREVSRDEILSRPHPVAARATEEPSRRALPSFFFTGGVVTNKHRRSTEAFLASLARRRGQSRPEHLKLTSGSSSLSGRALLPGSQETVVAPTLRRSQTVRNFHPDSPRQDEPLATGVPASTLPPRDASAGTIGQGRRPFLRSLATATVTTLGLPRRGATPAPQRRAEIYYWPGATNRTTTRRAPLPDWTRAQEASAAPAAAAVAPSAPTLAPARRAPSTDMLAAAAVGAVGRGALDDPFVARLLGDSTRSSAFPGAGPSGF